MKFGSRAKPSERAGGAAGGGANGAVASLGGGPADSLSVMGTAEVIDFFCRRITMLVLLFFSWPQSDLLFSVVLCCVAYIILLYLGVPCIHLAVCPCIDIDHA